MDSLEFRTVLDWWMCSDPWPEGVSKEIVDSWLERHARECGYDGVVDAYHKHAA